MSRSKNKGLERIFAGRSLSLDLQTKIPPKKIHGGTAILSQVFRVLFLQKKNTLESKKCQVSQMRSQFMWISDFQDVYIHWRST
jgi:hypothetical protein